MSNILRNGDLVKNSVTSSEDGSKFKFLFNEMQIIFNKSEEGAVFINATQMAKIFKKRPNDWLSLESTKLLIESITRKNGNVDNQVVTTKKGGLDPSMGGTWLHEDLAIEFAGWLDIDFKLWCNDRLKEIFKFGLTGTKQAIEQALDDPDYMIQVLTKLKETRAKLKEQEPKVEYYNKVLETKNVFNITEIAQDLGMTSQALNKKLNELGVQHKVGNMWCLTKDYVGKDYADVSTYIVRRMDGSEITTHHLKWTEAGRKLITDLVLGK